MALQLSNFALKLTKDSEGNLKVHACATVQSSEKASMREYYEKEMSLDAEDLAELEAQYDAIKAQLKTEDSLE